MTHFIIPEAIGKVEPDDENDLHRAINQFPITNTSIFVRKKQSSASSGRQTTGSFSLKEVFSTIGTPLSARIGSDSDFLTL